jgi:hypothetical protein
VIARAIAAPSAVANDLKMTISSGVIPEDITTFEVEALRPKSSTPQRAKMTPRIGFLVFNFYLDQTRLGQ